LRVFPSYIPRTNQCEPLIFDPEGNATHPYHDNMELVAEFKNFTSYKNSRNGAIAGNVGDVRFVDFITADNKEAGIEFE
jgi:hypothetical protein